MKFNWAEIPLVFLTLPAYAAAFSGLIIGVVDGDTIDVMHNGKAERIRLYGIDCPEKNQPYGKKSKWFTSTLAFRKIVTVITKATIAMVERSER
ncbi:thermonuclease precursor [bacterium BMS3Abin14]|nr:thermonuclease precursor [bacterium BMS3Abin14]